MTETDSRAWRDVEWIKQERQVLQDYLAETPREEQSFQGWYNYAYILRGLPLFDGCMSEEVFNEIRGMQPAQAKRRPGRPKSASLSEDEVQRQEEERIMKAREEIRQSSAYMEAEAKGWVKDFRWQDGFGCPYLDLWLVEKGFVMPGPGGTGWPDCVFMRKDGKPIKKGSLASSYSQKKL